MPTDNKAHLNPTGQPCCDVIVIGGGPGGTTIASLLSEKGWQVELLEQDRHPRFHIGESLLPMNLPLLERLGILEQVKEIGVLKCGAEFCPAGLGHRQQTIYFSDALDKTHSYAFQVCRSEFDALLFKNSAAKGVIVHERTKVIDVTFRASQTTLVHTVDESGSRKTWETRFLVDASGRDTFLARKLGLKKKNSRHQSAAIFGHFRHVDRRSGKDEGNISIYWFEHGWFWIIPLRDGITSVGAVCWPAYLKTRRVSPAQFFWETIKLCPEVWARMQRAQLLGEVRATGNYSYRAKRMYGDGYLLVGDAFAFIDPVFSTGVFFAMNSAALGAKAVDAWLCDPSAAAGAMQQFERQVQNGIATVSWFIYRFTAPAMQQLFMAPRNHFRIKKAIISMLAGDIFHATPITFPLALFKGIYYATSITHLTGTWAAYQRRRYNAAIDFVGGTTPQDF